MKIEIRIFIFIFFLSATLFGFGLFHSGFFSFSFFCRIERRTIHHRWQRACVKVTDFPCITYRSERCVITYREGLTKSGKVIHRPIHIFDNGLLQELGTDRVKSVLKKIRIKSQTYNRTNFGNYFNFRLTFEFLMKFLLLFFFHYSSLVSVNLSSLLYDIHSNT